MTTPTPTPSPSPTRLNATHWTVSTACYGVSRSAAGAAARKMLREKHPVVLRKLSETSLRTPLAVRLHWRDLCATRFARLGDARTDDESVASPAGALLAGARRNGWPLGATSSAASPHIGPWESRGRSVVLGSFGDAKAVTRAD